MAVGPEYKNGYASYLAILRDVQTDIQASVQINPVANASTPSEDVETEIAERDALFQWVLGEIAALGRFEIVSATKFGGYAADVTP